LNVEFDFEGSSRDGVSHYTTRFFSCNITN
jgi:hypothetical protein